MPTLEIANLSDDLYQQIEKLARVHGRSIGEEAAAYLARGLAQDDEREAALMEEIRIETIGIGAGNDCRGHEPVGVSID